VTTKNLKDIEWKQLAFWHNVALHYNKYKPKGDMDRHAKSLETKWDDIKRDFIKHFVAAYDAINALD
jgi:hypothetical protein